MVKLTNEQFDNLYSGKSADFGSKTSEVAGDVKSYFAETAMNTPGSAVRFVKNMSQLILDPVTTVQSTYDLGKSVVALIPGIEGDETLARETGKYLADRYGGFENIKDSFREDPVGMLADIVSIAYGGAGITRAATAQGSKARKAADVVEKIGEKIDPVRRAGKALKATGEVASIAGRDFIGSYQSGLAFGKGGQQVLSIARQRGNSPAFQRGLRSETEGKKDRTQLVTDQEFVGDLKSGVKDLETLNKEVIQRGNNAIDRRGFILTDPEVNQITKGMQDGINSSLKFAGVKLDDILAGSFDKPLQDMIGLERARHVSKMQEIIQRNLNKLDARGRIPATERTNQARVLNRKEVNVGDIEDILKQLDDIRPTSKKFRAQQIHDDIRNNVAEALYAVDRLPRGYVNARRQFSKNKKVIDDIKAEFSLDAAKDSTKFNSIKRVLDGELNIPEQLLRKLRNGQDIIDKLAGFRASKLFPDEFLRVQSTFQPVARGSLFGGILGGAGGGISGGLLGALGGGALGALGGAGLGVGYGLLTGSPRITALTQTRGGQLARQLRRGGNVNDAVRSLQPAVRPLTIAGPTAGRIQEEVYEPLQGRRQGLLGTIFQ